MNGCILNESSQRKLQPISPLLRKVVERAAEITTQPFLVIEGLRTIERQRELYAQGKTQTLKSNHLTGNAVDIVPLVNNEISWDWEYFYPIADAMDIAADELGVPLVWGSAWNGTTNEWDDPKMAQESYKKLRRSQGKNIFLDGPHWELVNNYSSSVNQEKVQAITKLQQLLNLYGADLRIDGDMGPKTKVALEEFVKRYG